MSTRSTGMPKVGVWWIISCRDMHETVLDKGCLLETVGLVDIEDTGAEDMSRDAGGISTRVKFTEVGSKDREDTVLAKNCLPEAAELVDVEANGVRVLP